ncbi:GNAT family N-acetyltransferase [Ferrimonas aestuarii]|nr:GNAT family N-acetyltransferase [Ferrimonas aestuarii]
MPNDHEYRKGLHLRYQILRQPWGQPVGSELDEIESESWHKVIITEQGEVVGSGRLHRVDTYTGQIRYMAIAESCQGQGLGRVLLAGLEQQAVELGMNEVMLQSRENQTGFYVKLGYQDVGAGHTLFGSIAHRKMVKVLG